MNNNITYIRCGDYFIPDIRLSSTSEQKPLGKYGRMRKAYLKEHNSPLWNALILSEKLYLHLHEVDKTANRRMEQMMTELIKLNGVTEELKAKDQMEWITLMNACKTQAEEIILSELIYN